MELLERSIQSRPAQVLYRWLTQAISQQPLDWLAENIERISNGKRQTVLYTTFSSIPRRLGKNDLDLTSEMLAEAESVCAGWNPKNWSVDQAARSLLLLVVPSGNKDDYERSLYPLFDNADVNELIALNQSLPLLPHPESHLGHAINGIRSNITAVFNAVALNNPYPAQYFDELAWNQLVLKSLFIDSPLHQIQGLDQRANAKLARMLSDYAHERWAASRSVNPELWRPIGPFAEGDLVADLEKVLTTGNEIEQAAAALACAASSSEEAQKLLLKDSELQARIQDGRLTWETLVKH
ncbi:MAG: EboA family metabolite traffic protein [Cyanobacteria bacterium P01_F01_bin.150]